MAKKGTPTAKLNVVLLKASFADFEGALRDDHTLTESKLKNPIGDASALYIKEPHSNPPSWAKFLAPVSVAKLSLANASSSAVLFVQAAGRHFAFCFGHGRNEIRPEAIESGFGLKVTLNRVDPLKLRSIDAKTLENGVTTKRLQTSRNADQTAFGLDVARDLLRQVVGEPDDPKFAKKLAGSDSLTLHVEVTAGGLGEKCKQLVAAYQDNKYKQYFDWVDHLREINDPQLKQSLDERMATAFSKRQIANMHLAATSIVDWENVGDFKIGGAGRTVFHDLDIEEYADALGPELANVSLDKLKSYKIQAQFTADGPFLLQGSVYSSLVWETNYKNRFYAFVDGHWYEINNRFANTVTEFVKKIPAPSVNHLLKSNAGEKEGDYNSRVAIANPNLFVFDTQLVKPDGAATEIEFCDLFSKNKQLIHVKRKTRSATLSHLFAQGMVSAQLFLQDSEVRKQARKIIRDQSPHGGFLQYLPEARPIPGEYEVVYAIVAKPNPDWPTSLPFFSQINLMHSCKRLEGLGFRYSLQLIEEH